MSIIKGVLISVFILLGLSAIIGFGLYQYYNYQINKPQTVTSENSQITIEKGSSLETIAALLVENDLLSQPLILKAYMFLNPEKVVQAGIYDLPEGSITLFELVELFQEGSFDRKLTFIEGWRLDQYADYLEEKMGSDFADEFVKSSFVREGYMFPDTYTIESDYSPEDLASWMKNNFDTKVSDELMAQAGLRGLSPGEVVSLASILEREMHIEKDRPVVAGILVKRLRNDWALQADATLQYAKGRPQDWWPPVTRDDYRNLESEFNTYTNKGLPPHPICNPGLDAIEAVINFEESDYWFYITGSDGVTRYAETLEEHNSNVAKYL